jgi:hypothetical protein
VELAKFASLNPAYERSELKRKDTSSAADSTYPMLTQLADQEKQQQQQLTAPPNHDSIPGEMRPRLKTPPFT